MATGLQKEESILIYAELLSNLRQVSVKASLTSPSDSTTNAEVSDDGSRIRVRHNGAVETLILPTSVSIYSTLPLPAEGFRELSWRLPVPAAQTEVTRFSAESQSVPWGATDINVGSPICCRNCTSVIVPEGTIQTFKDLPSENWAEMMDFWHCHKPHDHAADDHHKHDNDQTLFKKGYGANSAIAAQPGVGLVDLISFMLSESDCSRLLFSSAGADVAFDTSEQAIGKSHLTRPLRIYCKICAGEIGLFNVLASAVTLFKWQVSCETISPSQAPSGSDCLVATLIASISRSGSSKSVILPNTFHGSDGKAVDCPQSLYLWVLNTNVVFASSVTRSKKTSIKVLYQDIDQEQGNQLVESMTSGVQEFTFPLAAIEAARQDLQASNSLLPTSERMFQQWNVGLLERWE